MRVAPVPKYFGNFCWSVRNAQNVGLRPGCIRRRSSFRVPAWDPNSQPCSIRYITFQTAESHQFYGRVCGCTCMLVDRLVIFSSAGCGASKPIENTTSRVAFKLHMMDRQRGSRGEMAPASLWNIRLFAASQVPAGLSSSGMGLIPGSLSHVGLAWPSGWPDG